MALDRPTVTGLRRVAQIGDAVGEEAVECGAEGQVWIARGRFAPPPLRQLDRQRRPRLSDPRPDRPALGGAG